MDSRIYELLSKVWLYPGHGGWHFFTLPKKDSRAIRKLFGVAEGGWGSLPVTATIGRTSWNTSIFRDKKSDAYLLPIKAEVRKKEGISTGDVVSVKLRIRV